MISYLSVAFFAAFAIAVNAILSKIILRFRICSSSLVGWLTGLAAGVWALLLVFILNKPFPTAEWTLFFGLTVCSVLALLFLHRAFQEADVSTVVPVMGIKITLTSLLAFFILKETHSPAVYIAVLLATFAVGLFGAGRQQKSQGGHGHAPIVGVLYAVGASCAYAVSDQFAKLAMDSSDPFTVVLWLWILTGVFCAIMVLRKTYRQYTIAWKDGMLVALNGAVLLIAIGALFFSFELADGVTVPNIIFGTRGFFALGGGIFINRFLPYPIEKQTGNIYLVRIAATVLIFFSILISVLFD